mgnify:FL=1
MDRTEIIERLKNIAEHAVHTVGERPFIMSLDDGIAVHEAIELLKKAETNHPEIPDSWIPVKAHPATDEEQESSPDIDYWFDCEMPDDEQEILVTVKHKNWISVEKDVCYVDSCYGLDSGYDWLDDIIAWMPLPEPYKEE